jgi:hypothetical protein
MDRRIAAGPGTVITPVPARATMVTSPDPPSARRTGLSKNQRIGIGLLLTFIGLALIAILFPTSPAQLGIALPVAAVGILALWVGGILMGIGSRS